MSNHLTDAQGTPLTEKFKLQLTVSAILVFSAWAATGFWNP